MVQLKFTPIFVTKLGKALVFKFWEVLCHPVGYACPVSHAIDVKEQLGCLII